MFDTAKEIRKFGEICMKTQKELKRYLYSVLANSGYKPVCQDGFLYAKGELPYLVTAHMDTVHKVQCDRYSIHRFKGMHRIQSKDGIGGDDRCGIYMILRMVRDGYKPSILFCEDEEIGCIGSGKFCKTEYINDLLDMKYLIELDRANANDAVFYECDNPEFTKFITETTGYKEAMGSFTDIVELSEASGIASVNFSCGYYQAHTTSEYVVFEEMENTLKVVEKLLRTDCEQFEFIPCKYSSGKGWFSSYYSRYDDWYDYANYKPTISSKSKKDMYGMEILYNEYVKENGEYVITEMQEWIEGKSEAECFGNFFMTHTDVCFGDILDWYPY